MKKIVYVTGSKYNHMIDECIKLDEQVYEPKYVGDKNFYTTAHNVRPENIIFAVDASNGRLAGYLLTTPISKAIYQKMKTGEYIDTNLIQNKDIRNISSVNENYLYIYSLVVSPEYQGLGISKELVSKLFSIIDELSKTCKINSILADTINPKAFGNMSKYGFVPIGVSSHESIIIEKHYFNDNLIEMVI